MGAVNSASWAACLVCLLSPSQEWGKPPADSCLVVKTFRDEAANSHSVVFGKLARARHIPNGGTKPRDDDDESNELVICSVLKGAPLIAGKKVLTIPHRLAIKDPKNPPQFLVFVAVDRGKLEPWRGVPLTPALAAYVKGLLAIDARNRVALMRYGFAFLEHRERAISRDAFHEFLKSSERDIRTVARNLPPGNLRRWLLAGRTLSHRQNLYAYLLGNCGDPKADAALLRKLLDRWRKEADPQIADRLLMGYALLDPRAGAAYVQGLLADPTTDFIHRYSGLRSAWYFYTTHPGVLTENEILDAVSLTLAQSDIADLAIDYLRQEKCWKLTGKILPLFNKKSFDAPLVRRSIVRYALQCPDDRSVRFVKGARKTHPSLVENTEELLQIEAEVAAGK